MRDYGCRKSVTRSECEGLCEVRISRYAAALRLFGWWGKGARRRRYAPALSGIGELWKITQNVRFLAISRDDTFESIRYTANLG